MLQHTNISLLQLSIELLRLWRLKNEECTILCLCYHGVPRSQPITLLRHFEFFILIIVCVPRSRLRGSLFKWQGILQLQRVLFFSGVLVIGWHQASSCMWKFVRGRKGGYITLTVSTGKSKSKMADNNSKRTNGQKSVNQNRNFFKLRLLTS